MEDKQVTVARQKFSGFLSPAQLDYKISQYETAAKKTYDSNKGSYQTHLANHLNKLNRDVHNSMNTLGISENNGLSIHKMQKAHDEFSLQHDRAPSSSELSKATGISNKFVSKYQDTLGKSMAISRDVNISPDEIDFNSYSSGLDQNEIDIAKSTLGLGKKPKGVARTSFFRRAKAIKGKIRKNYIDSNTRILHDS